MNRFMATATLSATLALAACGDSPTAATPSDDTLATADVATVAGDGTAEDVATMHTDIAVLGLAAPSVFRLGSLASLCPFDTATARFVCPPVTVNGVTVTRSWGLFTAAGAPQSAYDANLTASATFHSTIVGTVTGDHWSGTVDRGRTFTVSGLAGIETTRTINGSGAGTESGVRTTEGGDRTYRMTSSSAIAGVVVPVPFGAGAWPLSGTVTRTVNYSSTRGTETRSGTRTATVTFNGTEFVPLVVNGRTYTLDLALGKLRR